MEEAMKKLAVLCAFVLATMVAMAGTVSASTLEEIQKRGTLRVGMEPGYMPFELTNQKGEIIGFDVDMAKRMAASMGVELELVSIAWDGIIAGLLTDKFDIIMSGMTLTQERNLSINFAQPYILSVNRSWWIRGMRAPSTATAISMTPSTRWAPNSAPPASRRLKAKFATPPTYRMRPSRKAYSS